MRERENENEENLAHKETKLIGNDTRLLAMQN